MTKPISDRRSRRFCSPRVRNALGLSVLVVATAACDGPDELPAGRKRGPVRQPVLVVGDGQAEDAKAAEPVVQIGHCRPLQHVVFSPDKSRFVTTARDYADCDDRVLLWDTATGDKLREFRAKTQRLKPQFCLDSRAVVIGGNVWDTATGRLLHAVLQDDESPMNFRLSGDGRRLIVGVRDGTKGGTVRAVDLESGKVVASLSPSHLISAGDFDDSDKGAVARRDPPRLHAVGFTVAGTPLALIDGDRYGLVAVWNVATGKRQAEFKPEYCYQAEFSPDGNFVVVRWDDTNDSYEWAAVFDAHSGRAVASWSAAVVDCSDLAPVLFTPDGRYCLGREPAQRVTLLDLETGAAVRHFAGHTEPIVTMRLSDDGRVLETQSHDVAQRWEVATGKLLQAFPNSEQVEEPERHRQSRHVRTGMVPSADGKTILFGDRILDAATGELRHGLSPLMSVAKRFSPHAGSIFITHSDLLPGDRLALVAWQGHYGWSFSGLYEVASGKMVNRLGVVPSDWRFGLQWNRDGRRALTCVDGLHRLWDVARGRPLQTIGQIAPGTIYPTPHVAFSPNGKYAYIHGRQFGVFFWDAETGTARHHDPPGQPAAAKRALLDGREHGGYYVGRSTVSHDGRMAASRQPEQRKHQILVWDVDAGEVIRTLDHGELTPIAPFFSPDDRRLAVTCSHQTVVMWDLESGQRLYSLSPQKVDHLYSFPSVRFLDDGEHLLVNSAQRELTLHEAATGKLIRRMVDTRPKPESRRASYLREPLLISPDERYVLAAYASDYAIVWNLDTGEQVLAIERDFGGIPVTNYFRFSDDGRKLLTYYQPATLWDLETGQSQLLGDSHPRKEVPGFSKRQPPRPPGDSDRLQPPPPKILERFADDIPANNRGTGLTPDGKRLIVYHDDFGIAQWDVDTGKPICRCYLFHNGGRWLTILPDGRCRGSVEYVRYR